MSTHPDEDEHEDSNDYVLCDDEDDGMDNEDTIAEDELHELEEDNDLDALKADAELDIEELRRRYYPHLYETTTETTVVVTTEGTENAGSSDAPTEEADDEIEEEQNGGTSILQSFVENGEFGSDDDDEYIPKLYKPPRVGPEFQHNEIPEVDASYKPLIDDGDLLWKPSDQMSDQQIDEYQESVCELSQDMVANKLPALVSAPIQPRIDRPIPFWDSEEALYLLMQCEYDAEKAKKIFTEGPPDVNLPRKTHFGIYLPWEEDDLSKFETGLHVYLKQFHKIRKDYLPGRSLGEIIHFYYRWKKTERNDIWRQQHLQAYSHAQEIPSNSTDIMENIIELIEREELPAEEANVLVAEAQEITARIHGRTPP